MNINFKTIIIQFIVCISYLIAYIRVHTNSLIRTLSMYFRDYEIDDDIGIDIDGVWCVHTTDDIFEQHEITELFLNEGKRCKQCDFIIVDYNIVDDTNDDRIFTFFLDPSQPFETHAGDELAMTPPMIHFMEFYILTTQGSFDITNMMNKSLGPTYDFHKDLQSSSHSKKLLEFMMYTTDPGLYDEWKNNQSMDENKCFVSFRFQTFDGDNQTIVINERKNFSLEYIHHFLE